MKWFLFLLIVMLSCKREKKSLPGSIVYDSSIVPKKPDTTKLLIDSFEDKKENSPLDIFFMRNIDQSSLKFYKVNAQYSGDSPNPLVTDRSPVAGKKTGIDSIRIGKLLIVQLSNPEEGTLTGFKINGKKIKTTFDDVLWFNDDVFRHFTFKGKEYYYMQANILYSYGGSVGNLYYHMIYEVSNGELSTFASCRFDKTICFGDADGDDQLDFLHFNNDNFCTTVPSGNEFEVNLYSCNAKGIFIIQKDKKGKPYFIKGNSGENLMQDSFNISSHYWPLPIR